MTEGSRLGVECCRQPPLLWLTHPHDRSEITNSSKQGSITWKYARSYKLSPAVVGWNQDPTVSMHHHLHSNRGMWALRNPKDDRNPCRLCIQLLLLLGIDLKRYLYSSIHQYWWDCEENVGTIVGIRSCHTKGDRDVDHCSLSTNRTAHGEQMISK